MNDAAEVRSELLAAIIAHPDEDEPRVVLADHLMERGDPRGELIALQVELASGVLFASSRTEYRRRVDRLLEQHQDEWLAQLDVAPSRARFRRGFVEWLEGPAAQLLPRADHVFDLEPIEQLSLQGLLPDQLTSIAAASSWPSRVRSLKLRTAGALTAADMTAICNRFISLRALNLNDCGVTDKMMQTLAESRELRGLAMLALSGNDITDSGVEGLSQSPVLANCAGLFLSRNGLGDDSLVALATSPHLTELRQLGFDSNEVSGDEGVMALVRSRGLPRLERLELKYAELSEQTLHEARARFGLVTID